MAKSDGQPLLSSRFGLPLLVRELTESAARVSTYRRRVLCAIAVYVIALFRFSLLLPASTASPLAILGIGRAFFFDLIWLAVGAVCVLAPGLTAGSLTSEKELRTLELLFLTRLGPWTILLEKLASGLMAAFSLLLPILPLLAVAYSLGGITGETLWSGVIVIVVTALELATLGLACSACVRRTPLALTLAYGLALCLLLAPTALLMWLFDTHQVAGRSAWFENLTQSLVTMGYLQSPFDLLFPTFPAYAILGISPRPASMTVGRTLVLCIPSVVVSVVLLRLAHWRLVPGAAPPSRRSSRLSEKHSRDRTADGPSLIVTLWNRCASSPLPDKHPVFWRDSRLSWSGQARMAILKLTLVAATLLGLITTIGMSNPLDASASLSLVLIVIWFTVQLLIVLQAVACFSGERIQQSLELLCTTPLPGRQLVLEKWWALRRLIFGAGLVLLIVAGTNAVWRYPESWSRIPTRAPWEGTATYLAGWFLTLCVTMPMFCWMGLWVGLRWRNSVRAVQSALILFLSWCLGPALFVFLLLTRLPGGVTNAGRGNLLWISSPIALTVLNEAGNLSELGAPAWVLWGLQAVVCGVARLCFRENCLRNADRWLGRLDSDAPAGDRPALHSGNGLVPFAQRKRCGDSSSS